VTGTCTKRLEQQLRSAACKTKDSQTLLRAGYTLQARYSFKGSTEEVLISFLRERVVLISLYGQRMSIE